MINYTTSGRPAWLADPVRNWLVVIALGLLLALVQRPRQQALSGTELETPLWPQFGQAPASLRPPSLDRRVRGREPELARLRELSRAPDGRFVVICGAGGMGKTALAAACAEQARLDRLAVFWIRHRPPSDLAGRLAEVAVATGLPPGMVTQAQHSNSDLTELVWGHLDRVRGWLIVLDDLDHSGEAAPPEESVREYRGWVRPSAGGLLVVTSRDRDSETWGSAAVCVEIGPLTDAAGAEVLCDAAPGAGGSEEARELSARLGGLPLALRAAGRSLTEPTSRHHGFTTYLQALNNRTASVLPERPNVRDTSVARQLVGYTWELSLDQLVADGVTLARPVMRLLSLLADAPIPRSLVTPDALAVVTGHRPSINAIDSALAGLHRYGLLYVPDRDRMLGIVTVTLHSLVREANIALLDQEGLADEFHAALNGALASAVDEVARNGRLDWDAAQLLAPHVLLLNTRCRADRRYPDIRIALDTVADVLHEGGRHNIELDLRRLGLSIDEHVFAVDHPRTLVSRSKLARAVHSLGRHQEAADLHRQVLVIREEVLGAENGDTLESRNNYANSLNRIGRHQEAADLHRRVLAIRERTLGPRHVDTLRSRNNLANALDDLGQYQEAADLRADALSGFEATLGPDHRMTLQSRNNLASILPRLGRSIEAAGLYEETLRAQERELGADHPDTLVTRVNLAVVLGKLGRLDEAVILLERAGPACELVLGPEHPNTLLCRQELATALYGLGQAASADREN